MPALAENLFVWFLFLGFRAISKPSFLKKYSGLTKTSTA
ncbi:AzlC family protein, partial [Neisseria meningitidis]